MRGSDDRAERERVYSAHDGRRSLPRYQVLNNVDGSEHGNSVMSGSDVESNAPFSSCYAFAVYYLDTLEFLGEELKTAYRESCKKLSWWNPVRWLCVIVSYVYIIITILLLEILSMLVLIWCIFRPRLPDRPSDTQDDLPEAAEEGPERPILLRRLRGRPQKPPDRERTAESPTRTLSNCPRCLATAITLLGIVIYALFRKLARRK